MTIFRTPYETSVGRYCVTDKIANAIRESIVKDLIFTTTLGLSKSYEIKPLFVTGLHTSETHIPVFNHPLLVTNSKGLKFLCFDFRPVVSAAELRDDKLVPKNKSEFDFALSRAALSLAWITGNEFQMKSSLNKAGTVYSAWLGETIAKRFALDPSDQLKITILSHYYWHSLFGNDVKNDEESLQNLALGIIQATRAPADLVFEVLEKAGELTDFETYCEAIKKVTENIRLKDINLGIVISLTGSSWFGVNARDLLSVALEHPPTWIAIVYAAINQRSYKHSLIAKVAERAFRGDAVKLFNQAYADFVKGYLLKTVPKRPEDLGDF